jgi:thiol:disulfide interchange protein DsbC
MIRILAALLLVVVSRGVAAEPAVDPAVEKVIRSNLQVPESGLVIQTVSPSPMPVIYEVQFSNGPLVYTTATGDFFIVGDLFSVGPAGYVNLAEQRRNDQRREQVAAVDAGDMIVFPAQGETRATITVFTDVTCFYCQKLHREVPELNRRGIAVQYLAYPRNGIGSDGYRQLATAWCADDKQDVLTRLKNREAVADNVCPGNPVADQYQLGQQMGVRGTPAIVLESGQMIPGYQAPDDLEKTLGLN